MSGLQKMYFFSYVFGMGSIIPGCYENGSFDWVKFLGVTVIFSLIIIPLIWGIHKLIEKFSN